MCLERFRLLDRDTILYEATVTDPTVFVKPIEIAALHAEAGAPGPPDPRIQLPRRRAQPAALHRRGRRQEAESEVTPSARRSTCALVGRACRSARDRGAGFGRAEQQPAGAVCPKRLWDGKTPDFRGIWQTRGTAYVNVEGHPGGKGLAASPQPSRRSAGREDSLPAGRSYPPADKLPEPVHWRSFAEVLSGQRAARDISRDAAADSSKPRQLRHRLPGESRLPRLSSRHPAAFRCDGLVDGRYTVSMGG